MAKLYECDRCREQYRSQEKMYRLSMDRVGSCDDGIGPKTPVDFDLCEECSNRVSTFILLHYRAVDESERLRANPKWLEELKAGGLAALVKDVLRKGK